MSQKIIALILSLFCTEAVMGQKIHFSDTSNLWSVVTSSCGGDEHMPLVDVTYYSADTIFNGAYYKVLSGYQSNAFIREDTSEGKVYAFVADYPSYDTTEQLLYDYTLQFGDTFVSKFTRHVVSGIDSVVINNTIHKVWYLSCIGPFGQYNFVDYKVIEGLGCTNAPLYPSYPYFFEECIFEICFNNNGGNPVFGNAIDTFHWQYYPYFWFGTVYYDNVTSCAEDFNVAVHNVSGNATETLVFPNPITSSSKIILPGEISSGTLWITNQLGQLIQQREITRQKEINIGDAILQPGLYYYHIYDNINQVSLKGKFVRI